MILKDNMENRAQQEQLGKESVEQEKIAKKLLKQKKMDRRLSDRSSSRLSTDGESIASTDIESIDVSVVDDPEEEEIKFKNPQEGQDNSEGDDVSDAETDTQTEPSNSPGLKLLAATEEEPVETEQEADRDDEDEGACHEVAPLVLSEGLKRKLEMDHTRVTKKKKSIQLPAQPNIVSHIKFCILLVISLLQVKLLEIFVKNFAIQRLAQLERQISRNQYGVRLTAEKEAEKYEEAVADIDLCKEVADGLRIITDFNLGKLLLYPSERLQFQQSHSLRPPAVEREAACALPAPVTAEEPGVREQGNLAGPGQVRKRKTTGRSVGGGPEDVAGPGAVAASAGSTSSGTGTPTLGLAGGSHYPSSSKSHKVLAEHVHSWKIVPESLYFEEPVPSSLVYGGIHLARLLVRLPEVMARMKFRLASAKNLHKYLENLESFLAAQPDIFVEDSYK
jgi:male-specific lethal 3